jgi:hypothetical protein
MVAETAFAAATVTGARAIGAIVDRSQRSGIIPLFFVVLAAVTQQVDSTLAHV